MSKARHCAISAISTCFGSLPAASSDSSFSGRRSGRNGTVSANHSSDLRRTLSERGCSGWLPCPLCQGESGGYRVTRYRRRTPGLYRARGRAPQPREAGCVESPCGGREGGTRAALYFRRRLQMDTRAGVNQSVLPNQRPQLPAIPHARQAMGPTSHCREHRQRRLGRPLCPAPGCNQGSGASCLSARTWHTLLVTVGGHPAAMRLMPR
jgi:hypothetical protein